MLSTVRGIVSRPSVATPWAISQSAAVWTTVLPAPAPWRSGRTARGPIHPSVPDRWAMLNAATWTEGWMGPLAVRPDRQGPHPPFGPRPVGDVERRDVA